MKLAGSLGVLILIMSIAMAAADSGDAAGPSDAALARTLNDATALATAFDDGLAIAGLGFADASCQAKFGAARQPAKAERAALAQCIAALKLSSSGGGEWVAGGAGAGVPSLYVVVKTRGSKVVGFSPPAAMAGETLPTFLIGSGFDNWGFAVSDALDEQWRNTPGHGSPEVKICLDASGKVMRSTLARSGGVAEIDEAFRVFLAAHPPAPFNLGGKPAAACAFVGWTPPQPASAVQIVPPKQLEGFRVAGSPQITPDLATKQAIAASGKSQVIGSFKLCVAVDGRVASVKLLKTTGFPDYDKLLASTIQSTWKYKPFEIDGKPVAVCTAVTFIYRQQ